MFTVCALNKVCLLSFMYNMSQDSKLLLCRTETTCIQDKNRYAIFHYSFTLKSNFLAKKGSIPKLI